MFMNNKCAGHCQGNSSKLHHHREVMWRGLNDQHQMQRPADSLHKHVHVCHCWDKKIHLKILYWRIPFLGHISTRTTALFLQSAQTFITSDIMYECSATETTREQLELTVWLMMWNTKPNTHISISSLFKMLIVKCLYKAEFMNL